MEHSDVCPKTGTNHVPNLERLTVEYDGDGIYVDVLCAVCGTSGCIAKVDLDSISWA